MSVGFSHRGCVCRLVSLTEVVCVGWFLSQRLCVSVGFSQLICCRVRTGPGKPGKSWNLIIWIPGLESHGILDQVLESHGISCWQICMQQSCLRSRAAYCSGLSDMYAGKTLNYGNM